MLESGSAQAPAEGGRGWAANRHQEIPHITSFSWGISGTSIVTPPPHPSRAPQHGRSSVMPGAFPVLGAEHQFIDERMVRASAWSERGWGKSGFQSENPNLSALEYYSALKKFRRELSSPRWIPSHIVDGRGSGPSARCLSRGAAGRCSMQGGASREGPGLAAILPLLPAWRVRGKV